MVKLIAGDVVIISLILCWPLQAHSQSHHQAICGCFFPHQWFINLIVGDVIIPSSSLLMLLHRLHDG
jgi:hypothetical protein